MDAVKTGFRWMARLNARGRLAAQGAHGLSGSRDEAVRDAWRYVTKATSRRGFGHLSLAYEKDEPGLVAVANEFWRVSSSNIVEHTHSEEPVGWVRILTHVDELEVLAGAFEEEHDETG